MQNKSMMETIQAFAVKQALHYMEHDPEKNLPKLLLENPAKLQEMVRATGAKSTDLQSPETVEHLCGKCEAYAKAWAPMTERLWAGHRGSGSPKPTAGAVNQASPEG